jgi:DNA (cytosine-5)-methyltransferase 1
MCFFENVEGHVSIGLRQVLADLEARGYKTAWGIFSAAEVGAPHQRKRVFILAHSKDKRCGRRPDQNGAGGGGLSELESQERSMVWSETTRCRRDSREELADSKSWESRKSEAWYWRSSVGGGQEELADTDRPRLQGHRRHESEHDAEGRKVSHGYAWPSRPGEPQHEWEPPRTLEGKLNPDWVETLMGLPQGWTGTGNRIDRLRLLGNGVVPQTAALAWKTLNKKLENV